MQLATGTFYFDVEGLTNSLEAPDVSYTLAIQAQHSLTIDSGIIITFPNSFSLAYVDSCIVHSDYNL